MKLTEMAATLKSLNAKVEAFFSSRTDEAAKAEKAVIVGQITALEETASKDLTEATNNLTKTTAALEKAQAEVNAHCKTIGDANARVNKFLASAKVEVGANATLLERIELALGSVTATLAKQGVKMEDIPAGSTETGGAKVDHVAQYNKLVAEGKGVEASRYYFRHRADIQSAGIASAN